MPQYNPNDFYPESDAEVKSDGNVAYRENVQGSLLPSQARTITTSSTNQTNYNARGVIVNLDVSVASGTGGLQVRFIAVDPVSGNNIFLNNAPTAIVATGRYAYILYPSASTAQGNVSAVYSLPLPKTWFVQVTHGDGTSYTYSVSYSYIL